MTEEHAFYHRASHMVKEGISLRTTKHTTGVLSRELLTLGPCDVRGVMLHPLPGPSRRCWVPPSADIPWGNTLGSITRAVK